MIFNIERSGNLTCGVLTVFIEGTAGDRQRRLGAALAPQVSSWKGDGWRGRWMGQGEEKGKWSE